VNVVIEERAVGALLGLAVGDALGTTLEFSARDAHSHHTEMVGGGPFRLQPGEWTDDTAMAVALAESLLSRGEFDARDLMERYVAWWKRGEYSCTGRCFDIGITTREALARYLRTRDPYSGSHSENTAGNGSIMRLAPVVCFALDDPSRLAELAREQSRTTHAAPQAVGGCELLSEIIRDGIVTGDRHEALRDRPWNGHASLRPVAEGAWRTKRRDQISSSGYVVSTLEAALWAVWRTDTFEDALTLAVNLANDADTVGAVTGQIAGALYGAGAIPDRWLKPLAWRIRIEQLARNLFAASHARTI
jgi:ADP-ribosyl-[dinitrogen reductase] hydrolase